MDHLNILPRKASELPLKRLPRIIVFDSGLGGLSVLAAMNRRIRDADVIYVADDAAFPYGDWTETDLAGHVVTLIEVLLREHRPDLVVIACNTASTLVLPLLRARFQVPFVGTVPAIKPAAEITRSGLVSVLATPGTVARDYTRGLIEAFASSVRVTLVGSTRLAGLAENWLRGEVVDDAAVRAEILPCFQQVEGARTDTIVLGCTHYPLLHDRLVRLAPWSVHWIDGAEAIARRVSELLPQTTGKERHDTASGRIIFTSGRPLPAVLAGRLGSFRLVG